MDGLLAKRTLIALAKKLGFDTVKRTNHPGGYALKLVDSKGRRLPLAIMDEFNYCSCKFIFKSAKWENILRDLEGKTIPKGNMRIVVNSVEQLIIDLELEGFLTKT